MFVQTELELLSAFVGHSLALGEDWKRNLGAGSLENDVALRWVWSTLVG